MFLIMIGYRIFRANFPWNLVMTKWSFVVPMILMCIVGLGVLVATFGQIVYGTF